MVHALVVQATIVNNRLIYITFITFVLLALMFYVQNFNLLINILLITFEPSRGRIGRKAEPGRNYFPLRLRPRPLPVSALIPKCYEYILL